MYSSSADLTTKILTLLLSGSAGVRKNPVLDRLVLDASPLDHLVVLEFDPDGHAGGHGFF